MFLVNTGDFQRVSHADRIIDSSSGSVLMKAADSSGSAGRVVEVTQWKH